MLIVSLIFSVGVLVYANILARFVNYSPVLLFLGSGAILVLLFSGGLALTTVALQVVALVILTICFERCQVPKSKYLWSSVGVTVLTYVVVFLTAVLPEQMQLQSLRNEFPIESMETRAPTPTFTVAKFPLKAEVDARLSEFQENERGNSLFRTHMLQRLHENTIELFITSPGFGQMRMIRPSERSIRQREEDLVPVPQPGERDTSAQSMTDQSPNGRSISSVEIHDLHRQSMIGFLDESRFGYVKSRTQVAGFLPHQFRWPPSDPKSVKLQTLDLIGLVVHPKPVAYVSDNLPRMEELRKAPTRELNEFELAGLEEIKKGDDLFAREGDTTLRLFGAIRATKQCTECHGCQRGDLLGAFSYVLKRSTP